MGTPRIYRIAKGHLPLYQHGQGTQKKILGGKGAGLWQMVEMGLNVPPAFCITTEVCNEFMAIEKLSARDKFLDGLLDEVTEHMAWLTDVIGYAPLVSVRSGAPVSMPGMMDTILNVGLNLHNLPEWKERLGGRAALDSYRRLIQMLGSTGYGIDMGVFDFQLARVKKDYGVTEDKDLTVQALSVVIQHYKIAFEKATGHIFPDSAVEQLRIAIRAVFMSWANERAIEYRKINKIDAAMGTACNVQAMVFGNLNDDSGTGVLFTRNPSTGGNEIMGEFLQNAQGEDVVAGIRTPLPLPDMETLPEPWPEIAQDIAVLCGHLEDSYRDMVDIEFTVQDGTLFVLQSRVGKRSAAAAFKIAADLVADDIITVEEALKRITRSQYKIMRRPTIDPAFKGKPNNTGLPACPGVAVGRAVFSSKDAVAATDPVVLVTHETDPDDIAGMNKAVGILTVTGGATSHAAVVARAMDKPCVVGCTDLPLVTMQGKSEIKVTIDGATGRVWLDTKVPIIDASESQELATVIAWVLDTTDSAQSVAYIEEAGYGNVCVHAALWWGDEAAMEVALDEIMAAEDVTMITLDVTPPKKLAQAEDTKLYMAFGYDVEAGNMMFPTRLRKYVQDNADKLKGLTIQNAPDVLWPNKDVLKEAGILFTGEAKTVADLLNGAPVTVGDEFIKTVLGGVVAYETLLGMIQTAGVKPKVVRNAVPVEYAVFSALAD